jgi:hypothetical protein
MASSSTSTHVPPKSINIDSQQPLSNKPETTTLKAAELRLVMEQPVDFESLKANKFDLKELFEQQGWMNYFEMLNGDIYPTLVKDFWLRAEVYDRESARRELEAKIAEDPENNIGKSRSELGLEPFSGTVIKSTVMGLKARITRSDLAQLLNVPNKGKFLIDTDKGKTKITKYQSEIKDLLFLNKEDYGKSTNLHLNVRILFKILTSSIIPRVGGADQISWDLKHFLLFLLKGEPINLPTYIFHFLCLYIQNTKEKNKTLVAYPRVLSELFYQCGLIERLKAIQDPEVVKTVRSPFFTAEVLVNMHKIKKKDLIFPNHPLTRRVNPKPISGKTYNIYQNEPIEVIMNYMALMKEGGLEVHPADIGIEPEVDLPKRKRTSRKRKQEDDAEEAEPPKRAKGISIQEPASEARPKEKIVEGKGKQREKLPFVTKVLEDSEDSEDDVPLIKRFRKEGPSSAVPEESSGQGKSTTSESIPSAQTLSSFPIHSNDEVDGSQPISFQMPGSTLVLPVIPTKASTPKLTQLKETLTELRQKKIDEINELAQQYQDLPPLHQPSHPVSDSITMLEQHYNGEFEQALKT